jgi:hypothetical protein
VYIYRDTGGEPGDPAADPPAHDSAEHDTAYWYDLPAQDPAPKRPETRGPFEPLVSSRAPAIDPARQRPAGPTAAATAAETAGSEQDQVSAGPPREDEPDEIADARARQLEQIKDFYLTAEAMGEHNVEKHFDQLLAQQRELISEYFRRSAPPPPAGASARDEVLADAHAEPHNPDEPYDLHDFDGPGMAGGQAGTPQSAGVASEPPRAW